MCKNSYFFFLSTTNNTWTMINMIKVILTKNEIRFFFLWLKYKDHIDFTHPFFEESSWAEKKKITQAH